MKKTLIRAISFCLTLCLLTGLLAPLAGAVEYEGIEPITVNATAALLVDLDTDQVLLEQSADETRYPASITKIMTALLTLEAVGRGELNLDTLQLLLQQLRGGDAEILRQFPDGEAGGESGGILLPLGDHGLAQTGVDGSPGGRLSPLGAEGTETIIKHNNSSPGIFLV